ncbi:hypothetical protein R9X47_26825 [Wukongibacter baidiensis]|uniref:hypothetical protein n=1 Tax=Wukongibacter baidiensis TaxID=1723361 RepID=UPI003D7FCF5E
MKDRRHSKNDLDRSFTSKVGTEKSKSRKKSEEISECYKMKLEHSEELNPDDFE